MTLSTGLALIATFYVVKQMYKKNKKYKGLIGVYNAELNRVKRQITEEVNKNQYQERKTRKIKYERNIVENDDGLDQNDIGQANSFSKTNNETQDELMSFYSSSNSGSSQKYTDLRKLFFENHFADKSRHQSSNLLKKIENYANKSSHSEYAILYDAFVTRLQEFYNAKTPVRIFKEQDVGEMLKLIEKNSQSNTLLLQTKIWEFRILIYICIAEKQTFQHVITENKHLKLLTDYSIKNLYQFSEGSESGRKKTKTLHEQEFALLQLLFVKLMGDNIHLNSILEKETRHNLTVVRLVPWCIALSEVFGHRESRDYMISVTRLLFNTKSNLSPILLNEFDTSRLFAYVASAYNLKLTKNINIATGRHKILLTSNYCLDNSSRLGSTYKTHIQTKSTEMKQNSNGGCFFKSELTINTYSSSQTYNQLQYKEYLTIIEKDYTVIQRKILNENVHVATSLLICTDTFVYHYLTFIEQIDKPGIGIFIIEDSINKIIDSSHELKTLDNDTASKYLVLENSTTELFYSIRFGNANTKLYNDQNKFTLYQHEKMTEIFVSIEKLNSGGILVVDYLAFKSYFIHRNLFKTKISIENFKPQFYPEIKKINNMDLPIDDLAIDVSDEQNSNQPYTMTTEFDDKHLKNLFNKVVGQYSSIN